MLRRIYVILTQHNIRSSDAFIKEARYAGFEVEKGTSMDIVKCLSPDQCKESLLITDCDVTGVGRRKQTVSICDQTAEKDHLQLPVIGYGIDFTGDTHYLVEDFDAVSIQYMKLVYARYWQEPLVIAEDDRLLIREMTMQDMDLLYELYATLEDCPYIEPLYERTEEEEFEKQYIKNMYGFYQYGLWLVFRKEDGCLIGRAGIENRVIDGLNEQELGYLIGRPWQNQEYASCVCQKIIQYAFEELYLEKLFACIDKTNIPSIALANRMKFQLFAEDIDGKNLYILKNWNL
jgi:RimJ/RimL family protein N-acetyltransferase